MCSCAGETKNVTVRDVEIDGQFYYYDDKDDWGHSKAYDANDFLTVEDGSYKFSVSDGKLVVELPVKTIKSLPPMQVDEVDDFYLALLDSEEYYIENSKGDDVDMELANTEVIDKILSSNVGDKNILKFHYALSDDTDILNQIHNIELFIDINVVKKGSKPVASKSSGSNDWDKVLDEYEQYVNNYIAICRKINSGDMSAMSAYTDMLEKAESYGEKLSNAEGSMSSSQMNRYLNLTERLSSVFIEIDDEP